MATVATVATAATDSSATDAGIGGIADVDVVDAAVAAAARIAENGEAARDPMVAISKGVSAPRTSRSFSLRWAIRKAGSIPRVTAASSDGPTRVTSLNPVMPGSRHKRFGNSASRKAIMSTPSSDAISADESL